MMIRLLANLVQKTSLNGLVVMLFMGQTSTVLATEINPPKLTFEYGSVLDLGCESLTNTYVQLAIAPGVDHHTEIMKEASSLTPALQKQWDEQGPILLSKLMNLVGRDYSKDELIVYTSACQSGAMSTPLIVGIKLHLKSVRKKPLSISHNVSLTFHEFIHRYLTESFDYSRSAVLKEFSDAPALFKNHLHLMALMKESFKLAKRDDLIKQYPTTLRGAYKSAWDISTSQDYQQRLINEVQTLEGNNKNYWFFDPFVE